MFKLILLIFVSVALAKLSYDRSRVLNKYGKQEEFFFSLLVIFLVFFIGLRYHWNDTQTYIGQYQHSGLTLKNFFQQRFNISDYYGYLFIMALCKSLKMDSVLYMMLYAAFYVTTYMWFLRKYARNFLPMAAFLFIVGGFTFLMAAMKQVTATAFALIAVDRMLQKKRVGFFFFLFLGYLFHPSVIVFLATPFLINIKPWSGRTYLFILVLALLGVFMEFTSELLDGFMDYGVESMLDHTVDPLRFTVTFAPIIFSFIYRNDLYSDSGIAENLFFHFWLCQILFMFWALFGNPILFARMSSHFDLFACISLAWCFWKLERKRNNDRSIPLIKVFACICYLGVSFCSNYFLASTALKFDNRYRAFSLGDFFSSFFGWLGELL